MKFVGSKARFRKAILEIVLADRKPEQFYVEPFLGGANSMEGVTGNRIGNDSNRYLIAMWRALLNGWEPPLEISREQYHLIKNAKQDHAPELVGYVGFNCSYSGKWFGGYAGKTQTKVGTIRDYQNEAYRNVMRQVPKLIGLELQSGSYRQILLPSEPCIIYCDPPYEGTTKYGNQRFNHVSFWHWVREMSQVHTVFVSEYNAPDDFVCVWEKTAKSSLSANGKVGGNKNSVERLFKLA